MKPCELYSKLNKHIYCLLMYTQLYSIIPITTIGFQEISSTHVHMVISCRFFNDIFVIVVDRFLVLVWELYFVTFWCPYALDQSVITSECQARWPNDHSTEFRLIWCSSLRWTTDVCASHANHLVFVGIVYTAQLHWDSVLWRFVNGDAEIHARSSLYSHSLLVVLTRSHPLYSTPSQHTSSCTPSHVFILYTSAALQSDLIASLTPRKPQLAIAPTHKIHIFAFIDLYRKNKIQIMGRQMHTFIACLETSLGNI